MTAPTLADTLAKLDAWAASHTTPAPLTEPATYPYGDHQQPPRRDQADPWPDGRREHWDAES